MNLNLDHYRITLVIAPIDGRCGYDRLAAIGRIHCGIDVDNRRDALVFVSRRYSIAKVILRDNHGRTMIARWVDVGRFEKFLHRDGDTPKTTKQLSQKKNYSIFWMENAFKKRLSRCENLSQKILKKSLKNKVFHLVKSLILLGKYAKITPIKTINYCINFCYDGTLS